MAASAWSVFNAAKKRLGNGTLSLSAAGFKMSLHSNSASTNLSGAITVFTSIGSEVGAAAYPSNGRPNSVGR